MGNTFTIGDLEFVQNPLKLRESLKAQGLVLEAVLPAVFTVTDLASATPQDVAGALAGFQKIDQLVDLFAPVCQVRQGANMVALPPFLDTVFARRTSALMAWLVSCITWQFADFFDGTGLPLLAGQVNLLISRLGSTGGSGGS